MEKKQKKKTDQMITCPICKEKAIVKKGYENHFYVKCPNNCCVTKYFDTKEQAVNSWNHNEMMLTWQEKMRVGSYRPEIPRRKR